MTEDEMVGWYHRLSGYRFGLQELVMDREAWRAVVHGIMSGVLWFMGSCREPVRETLPVTRSGFKELAGKCFRTSRTATHAKASGPPGISWDRPTIHSQAFVLSFSDVWRSSMFPKN